VNSLKASRRQLDSVVVNIELTLVSIIQGVALFFLTDNARAILSLRHWDAFLYVAAGLCVIFIFWSRSVIHTLTLIKWPLEFGHNFFYIGCALGEAILFSRLNRPLAWFQLSATIRTPQRRHVPSAACVNRRAVTGRHVNKYASDQLAFAIESFLDRVFCGSVIAMFRACCYLARPQPPASTDKFRLR
jgi:hypothetical protein